MSGRQAKAQRRDIRRAFDKPLRDEFARLQREVSIQQMVIEGLQRHIATLKTQLADKDSHADKRHLSSPERQREESQPEEEQGRPEEVNA